VVTPCFPTVTYVLWALHPEALLGAYTPLGLIDLGRTGLYLFWGSILTLGSFTIATPILLLGWLMRRRR